MKVYGFAALFICFLLSCSKEKITDPPADPPEYIYTGLQDLRIGFNQYKSIDVDHDNKADFIFSTLLVGDPVLKRDRRQYYIHSTEAAFLQVNEAQETPVYAEGEKIGANYQREGYSWYDISSLVLAEKIIEESGNVFWQGAWKEVSHKFIAIRLSRNEKIHTGWIEISFQEATGEFILHRAAFNIVPGADSAAGE